ncbi:hypothetical protein D3C71_1643190 [compost metagenome]
MPGAVEQQHVQPVLQLADGVGDGGWHLAQLARGLGEAAVARDRVDQDEQFRGDGLHGGLESGCSKYLNGFVKI